MAEVTAYTDGSAEVKSRRGGIGVYIVFDHDGRTIEDTISVGFSETKTGRMEILAMIHAIARIKPESRASTVITVRSDSQYVVNSVEKGWVWNWDRHEGLENRTNGDLWKIFLEVYKTYPIGNVKLRWVRGHNGNVGNEIADMLAGSAYRSDNHIPDTCVKVRNGELFYDRTA